MTFVDIHPDVVFGAGRATAATSSEWDAWAGRAESLLRDVAGATGDPIVGGAFEDYLSMWNPTMKAAGRQATALGNGASRAAGSVAEGDSVGASHLRQTGARLDGLTSQLRRPIND
ncbi:hypothetical protein Athai_45790 [Actinocatenispora thailandica]|uniref:Uncharacterized protein n=1 Tax=Actinocatenispora thailandica TaxID=227318 RepID=A0A7R7DST1_9ACTN|nr:hypothetical protein [Actinocatenispora thailandica]BCJ37076.1 hypothetical protein Athai_45790 [Actinocatenispora thailandica]